MATAATLDNVELSKFCNFGLLWSPIARYHARQYATKFDKLVKEANAVDKKLTPELIEIRDRFSSEANDFLIHAKAVCQNMRRVSAENDNAVEAACTGLRQLRAEYKTAASHIEKLNKVYQPVFIASYEFAAAETILGTPWLNVDREWISNLKKNINKNFDKISAQLKETRDFKNGREVVLLAHKDLAAADGLARELLHKNSASRMRRLLGAEAA